MVLWQSGVVLRSGDLLLSEAQTLVNTVNCVGVMGKGLALDFKRAFPAMYEDYVRRCAIGEVRLGEPYLWRLEEAGSWEQRWVLNFPTKGHWRSRSRHSDIVDGLDWLEEHSRRGVLSRSQCRRWAIRTAACSGTTSGPY